jgi:hypothetical protein
MTAEFEQLNKEMTALLDRLEAEVERKLAAYNALAESHAELVAALTWAIPYVEDTKITLTQRVRDEHAKALYNAQAALTKARALMPEAGA